jgi:PAS domain S-box-containing protein
MSDSSPNQALRREALLSWIQQFAPYGVITLDDSFVVQSWNHWLESHSSLRSEDVLGKNLFTLFPDLRERLLVSHFERALKGESSVLSTALHKYLLPLPSPFRGTGVPHMLQTARISPLFSDGKVCGIVLVIEDVTQRESQAQTLERQHRHDQLLSWSLAQLLKTEQPRKTVRQLFFKIAEQLDFDSFLIYLRDAETGKLCLDASGGIPIESEKDFVNCPFLRVLATPNQTTVLNAVRSRRQFEFAALKKAGISAAVVIPLIANERDLGLLCFTTWTRELIGPDELELVDRIAQFLSTALDRENTNRQLQNARELLSEHAQLLEKRVQERTARLQETVSELETFSYTVAHDLRAPVRGITGYCEVLLEDFHDVLPPDASHIIKKISHASSRMESLTHDLLEFSKVSRQEIVLSKTEIEPIIEELATLQSPSYRQAISLRTPLLPVQAHKGMLQHVFLNLVDNAIKFVNPGREPKITIFTEPVAHASPNTRSGALTFSSAEDPSGEKRQSTPEKHHSIRIWVSDEGIGIAPEVHQKIFGIFERGDVSEKYEGTGIGLAIVARAVQRMGGTCGVESNLGKGSRFWLELPAG